jgi:hypothetical protein
MKQISYFDKFFSNELYKEFSDLSLVCDYGDTNPSKRSFSSQLISELNPELYKKFIFYVKNTLNINILESQLYLYKRKNVIFNPHVDGYPLHILVYLQGEVCNLNNGTFFMSKEENADVGNIILQTANIPNSAVIFDGRYIHGSMQATSNLKDKGWRYSLNCFITEYTFG